MHTISIFRGLLATSLLTAFAAVRPLHAEGSSDSSLPNPEGHAPIGVMADHMHGEGEWMLSYRYMWMSMDDLQAGTDSISNAEAFGRGFSSVPTEMTMDMHMFGMMYGVSDTVTLMLMTNYVQKEMDMVMNPGMEDGGHMHSDHGHSHGHDHGGGHSHATSGWGDTVVTLMVHLWSEGPHTVHAGFGVGLPTAEVEEKMGGMFQPYGMQLGTGLWDARPSLTYNGRSDGWNWGGQLNGRINLESENDAGFRPGNSVGATTWLGRRVATAASLSGRLAYQWTDEMGGHYNGPHPHSAPPHFTENYGGEILNAGFGINTVVTKGPMLGHRLAFEVLVPLWEDVNGVRLAQELSVVAGWQFAW